MLAKYQPLARLDDADEYADVWIEDNDARPGDVNRPDLAGDVLWAYQNLARRSVHPKDAPNAGAWALLSWARRYRNRFFEVLFRKALSASAQQSRNLPVQHARTDDKEDEGLRRLEAIFEETRQANEERRKEAMNRQA